MATIINGEILTTYHVVKTNMEIILNETRNINRDKSRLDTFVPKDAQKLYSSKQADALKFIEEVNLVSFDYSVVALVSKFEKIAFEKYRNTYGKLRTVINNNTNRPLDYFASREKFIRDDVDKLSGILKLIEGHIDSTTFKDFVEIKDYRDYIAHGKRFSKPMAITRSIDEIAEILDRVISAIEK